jgi:hypothetical protein
MKGVGVGPTPHHPPLYPPTEIWPGGWVLDPPPTIKTHSTYIKQVGTYMQVGGSTYTHPPTKTKTAQKQVGP